MRDPKTITLTLVALALALPFAGFADGGGAPSGAPSVGAQTPEHLALDAYNRGLRARNKGWKLEEKAAAADGAERDKLEAKVETQFTKAAEAFRKAIELNPVLYQAHGSLGYALRRLGDYESSLGAYDRALELNPNYPEAIEYRAEAFLALDRVEPAQQAYAQLRIVDPARAELLLEAFESWVERRRGEAGRLDPEAIEGIARWVEERREVASTTAEATATRGSAWK